MSRTETDENRVILIAVGANLPDVVGRRPIQTCRWALTRIAERTGLALEACSSWWRSAPVPPSGQPDYVNGVARYTGAIAPEELLAVLHTIEAEAGRVRSVPNAARPLDLDLLAVGSERRDGPGLLLPHPRLAERAFVLVPLAEVAPGWMGPGGETVEAMLRRVDLSELVLAESGDLAVQ